MPERSVVRSLRVGWKVVLALVSVVALASCTKQPGANPPRDTTSASSGGNTASDRGWGKPSDPIDRDCVGCPPNRQTQVIIQPKTDEHNEHHQNPGSKPLVVMARMKNVGPYEDAIYHIPPHSKWWYVVWVDHGNEKLQYVLQLPTNASDPDIDLQGGKPVYLCNDTHGNSTTDEAGFTDCARKPPGPAPSPTSTTRRSAAPTSPRGTIWLACSQGCCTAEAVR